STEKKPAMPYILIQKLKNNLFLMLSPETKNVTYAPTLSPESRGPYIRDRKSHVIRKICQLCDCCLRRKTSQRGKQTLTAFASSFNTDLGNHSEPSDCTTLKKNLFLSQDMDHFQYDGEDPVQK
ncbi:MAG: hypothetical protein VXZ72_03715, partial [Chlamydiota bacterium]|nr:hypothetical protein [Chlamydiota bacterium]